MEVSTVGGRSRSHCFHQFQRPQIHSADASMSFQFPYTPHYFHFFHECGKLLPQDSHKGPPTCVPSTCIESSTNFYGNFHGSQCSSIEASVENGGGICLLAEKFQVKLVEVDLLLCKLVEASMEVLGVFQCRWKWKLQSLPSNEAATDIIFVRAPMSFHISLSTATYFHEYLKLPAASTKPTQTLTLTKTPTQIWSYRYRGWSTSNFHGSRWKYMEVVCCFQGSWSYLLASWRTSNFRGSWWKLPWKQM